MADERILVNYRLEPVENGPSEIRQKKTSGDRVIEDKVVARFDVEAKVLRFENGTALRNFKTPVTTFLAENAILARHIIRDDLKQDPPLTKAIPPRPKQSKHEGDKHEPVVDWYFQYLNNEFCSRYGVLGRYTGKVIEQVPTWRPRPIDGQLEYVGSPRVEKMVVNVIVATRKTHLTYTPDECVDWEDGEGEGEELAPKGPAAASRAGMKGGDE